MKKEEILTAEEFFRNKIKEQRPNVHELTLYTTLITGEEGLRWTKEYLDQQTKQLQEDNQYLRECLDNSNNARLRTQEDYYKLDDNYQLLVKINEDLESKNKSLIKIIDDSVIRYDKLKQLADDMAKELTIMTNSPQTIFTNSKSLTNYKNHINK